MKFFWVAVNETLSTSDLFSEIDKAKSKLIWLIPIPLSLLKLFLEIIGKGSIADRLYDSFEVDTSKAERLLSLVGSSETEASF